jgi:hypothetical protein
MKIKTWKMSLLSAVCATMFLAAFIALMNEASMWLVTTWLVAGIIGFLVTVDWRMRPPTVTGNLRFFLAHWHCFIASLVFGLGALLYLTVRNAYSRTTWNI